MVNERTCDLCGCTDFYEQAGYFFCEECQRQSQQTNLTVLEIDNVAAIGKSIRQIKKAQNDNAYSNLTTWECYNYIVLGLVNELIGLGADEKLRPVVKVLWFRYLTALEVIGKDEQLPKLQAVNFKRYFNVCCVLCRK